MTQGGSTGGVAEIAACGRPGMGEIFTTLRRTGWGAARCRDFIARGMLASVMITLAAPEHGGECAALDDLSECILVGDALRRAVG